MKKKIVLTGSTGVLGKAIIENLDQADHHLILHGRNEEKLASLKSLINNASFEVISFDILSQNAWDEFAENNTDMFALICCAGSYGNIGNFEEVNLKDWKHDFEVNFYGTINPIHSFLPYMKANKSGRIILFSGGGQKDLPNFSSYISSKGAIWRLTETLASECKEFGVTVNAIAPGAINSKFLTDVLEAGPEKVGEQFYNNALKQKENGGSPPEKTGECIKFLLSNNGSIVNGKTISSIWDEIDTRSDLESFNNNDIFTYKRVIDFNGSTKF